MKINRLPRPGISLADAATAAESYFGITGKVTELAGERDRNFLIEAMFGKKFVLKVGNAADEESVIDFQNRMLLHLSSNSDGWQWPIPQPDMRGQLISDWENDRGENLKIRLLTFVEGIFLADYTPHTSALMKEIGSFLGFVTRSLSSFSHPAMDRPLYWDMKHGVNLVQTHLHEITDEKKKDQIMYSIESIEKVLLDVKDYLREGVIYNDANDHNLLVACGDNGTGKLVGAIDVGDSVYSWLAAEPAVACAYAMLNKRDPFAIAKPIVSGYHKTAPLKEEEISALFSLILLRLCMSVVIAAHQKALDPENQYLSVSEKVAWDLIEHLGRTSTEFAHFSFRFACGLEPSPVTPHLVNWMESSKPQFSKIVDVDLDDNSVSSIDLSIENVALADGIWNDVRKISPMISIPSIGRYDEARMIYTADQFAEHGNESDEWRTVHLGVDLFLPVCTAIYAPLKGEVHSIRNNSLYLDYGPTVILAHAPQNAPTFYTLYGHLGVEVLDNLEIGQKIMKGEQFSTVGSSTENGGWPPHLHFQIITDMLGYEGDFPGVAKPSERKIWLSISPKPSAMLGLHSTEVTARGASPELIRDSRKTHLGPNLSLSYQNPLTIVRGWMQYLFDYEGRKYLDGVNNVPHVGHSHPKVVEAIQKQSTVLNTNTRYLHENVTRLAERIVASMPDPLSVCFFVNSGSEANDLALRLAMSHTGGTDIITLEGAYHGNLSTLIDISPYKFEGPGGSGIPDHVQMVSMPDGYHGPYSYDKTDAGEQYAEDVKEAIDRIAKLGGKVSAFIAESMISSGGLIIFPDNYLAKAYAHIHNAGGVCIADEVVVGFGRTGSHFWGFETQSVVPDIVTLGKPMGNGHPIAAVVTTPEIATSFDTGMEYFNTYGGNPVSCAAALAVLDILEKERLQENAKKVGDYLVSQLSLLRTDHPLVGDVRGSGFFIGVELIKDLESLESAPEHAAYIVERMKEKGILISTDGLHRNVLKIRPPMVFSRDNAQLLVSTLDEVLRETFCQQLCVTAD
ncbi:MAG: aminotransferase class III-fold pyridoxal phosphate-dependent enzyme [Candidatus Neomarinimicrobiota bacterium]|nr:aminotransferase class III-fold pyridoxal phosphate-dependent enzyme [Candidatus Neomarinimicrobiota bacterium]